MSNNIKFDEKDKIKKRLMNIEAKSHHFNINNKSFTSSNLYIKKDHNKINKSHNKSLKNQKHLKISLKKKLNYQQILQIFQIRNILTI